MCVTMYVTVGYHFFFFVHPFVDTRVPCLKWQHWNKTQAITTTPWRCWNKPLMARKLSTKTFEKNIWGHLLCPMLRRRWRRCKFRIHTLNTKTGDTHWLNFKLDFWTFSFFFWTFCLGCHWKRTVQKKCLRCPRWNPVGVVCTIQMCRWWWTKRNGSKANNCFKGWETWEMRRVTCHPLFSTCWAIHRAKANGELPGVAPERCLCLDDLPMVHCKIVRFTGCGSGVHVYKNVFGTAKKKYIFSGPKVLISVIPGVLYF